MLENQLLESLACNIGRTVTIFTTSGGLSGSGFTGVLAAVGPCSVKLITDIGASPACPIGSACAPGGFGGYGEGYGYGGGCGYGDNYGGGKGLGGYGRFGWLGSITEIPIDAIAGFTHHAI